MSSRERWATFDCYGTLIDWNGGIGDTLNRLWPDGDAERLLALFHEIEPLVQRGRGLPYREVLRRSLRSLAAVENLSLDRADDSTPFLTPDHPIPAGRHASTRGATPRVRVECRSASDAARSICAPGSVR